MCHCRLYVQMAFDFLFVDLFFLLQKSSLFYPTNLIFSAAAVKINSLGGNTSCVRTRTHQQSKLLISALTIPMHFLGLSHVQFIV